MQSSNDRSVALDPASPREADGYYYVDPTAPPAGSVNAPADFPQDGAYGTSPDAALLLLALFLLLLAAMAVAMVMRNGSEKPEDVIARAVQAASRTALAAYGPATIGAASVFGSAVRKYLGPVLDLTGPVSGALKKLDDAGKGKTKEPAKAEVAAAATPGARVVVLGDYNAPQPPADKPKEVERDMASDEQVAACRKAIEDLAAVLMAPDFRQRLVAARRALNSPPPAPRAAPGASAAAAPGGGAAIGSVGPRPAAARRPRHT